MIRFHVDRDGTAVRHVHVTIPASSLARAARGVRRFVDWYDGDTLALLILLELLDAVSR